MLLTATVFAVPGRGVMLGTLGKDDTDAPTVNSINSAEALPGGTHYVTLAA